VPLDRGTGVDIVKIEGETVAAGIGDRLGVESRLLALEARFKADLSDDIARIALP
jgi:hypothetical protein